MQLILSRKPISLSISDAKASNLKISTGPSKKYELVNPNLNALRNNPHYSLHQTHI